MLFDSAARRFRSPFARKVLRAGLVLGGLALCIGCVDPAPEPDASVAPPADGPSPGGAPSTESPRRIDAAFLVGLEGRVEAAIERHGVPGAAIATVEGDRVVHSRGFGVRELGRPAAVGADTLFRVADLTRAMTSTMAATLVDEDRLEWDASAATLGVELADAEHGSGVTLRHLLSMTSGVGGTPEHAFAAGEPSVSALLDGTRSFAVAAGLGDHVPSPALFAAASYRLASASASGPSGRLVDGPRALYHRRMQERLFGPAGMTRTVLGVRLEAVAEDHATPHAPTLGGGLVRVEAAEEGALAPAEGVASTVADLGRFLVLHLNDGMAESGQRVASAANLAATRAESTPVDAATAARWPLAERCAAAMGWTVCRLPAVDGVDGVAEEVVLGLVGGVDGFSAAMVLVPRLGVGLAVVANLDPRFGGLDFVTEVRDAFLTDVTGRPAAAVPASGGSVVPGDDALRERVDQLASAARPVRPGEVDAALGVYEDGWSLAMVEGVLELRRLLRAYPLQSLGGGRFVVSEGPEIGSLVRITGAGLELADTSGETMARVAKLY